MSAHACGICFVNAHQAAPFLEDGRSLSVEALAIVTTAELPPEACGKARVSSVRFPAVSGSLVQLRDDTVQLALDDVAELDQVDTCVCRLNLYRDEVEIPWDKILEAPLRALLQAVRTKEVDEQTVFFIARTMTS